MSECNKSDTPNPNPSGLHTAEPSRAPSQGGCALPEDSGPVGLGPREVNDSDTSGRSERVLRDYPNVRALLDGGVCPSTDWPGLRQELRAMASRVWIAEGNPPPERDCSEAAIREEVRREYEDSRVALQSKVNELDALLKECMELADNWPGVAYTADLEKRVSEALGGWERTFPYSTNAAPNPSHRGITSHICIQFATQPVCVECGKPTTVEAILGDPTRGVTIGPPSEVNSRGGSEPWRCTECGKGFVWVNKIPDPRCSCGGAIVSARNQPCEVCGRPTTGEIVRFNLDGSKQKYFHRACYKPSDVNRGVTSDGAADCDRCPNNPANYPADHDEVRLWALLRDLGTLTPVPPDAITWERGVEILNFVQDRLCPLVKAMHPSHSRDTSVAAQPVCRHWSGECIQPGNCSREGECRDESTQEHSNG